MTIKKEIHVKMKSRVKQILADTRHYLIKFNPQNLLPKHVKPD